MARKLINTKKISHDEWLSLRKRGIGGSDSSVVVDMNPYSGPVTLYSQKTGLVKDIEDNEAMRIGRDLEQYVADRFMEKTGKKVVNDNWFYLDDEYDFILANIDRKVVGENAGLECKTMGSFSGYNLEAGEIPSHYYCQCQHYMMVLGFDRMYLAVLVLQKGLYAVTIERDDDFIKQLRQAEIDFWTKFVEPRQMPIPDGEADLDTLKELYPEAEADTEIEIFNLDQMIEDYAAAGEMVKHYKGIQDGLKGQMCSKLGDYETGVGDRYGCSWKNQSKSVFDTKRFQKEHPEMYKEYTSTSSYRVFRTKTIKK